MRQITERGLDLVKSFEGFQPNPYLCPGGYQTIGYGHVIRGEIYPNGILEADAQALLVADLAIAERAVLRLIPAPLTDGQFDALVSFTFNLGAGTLQRSTLRSKVNREEHEDVPEEFLRWVRAGGQVLRGLVRRRIAEAVLYRS